MTIKGIDLDVTLTQFGFFGKVDKRATFFFRHQSKKGGGNP